MSDSKDPESFFSDDVRNVIRKQTKVDAAI
jgi:hypothetical protein